MSVSHKEKRTVSISDWLISDEGNARLISLIPIVSAMRNEDGSHFCWEAADSEAFWETACLLNKLGLKTEGRRNSWSWRQPQMSDKSPN